MNPPGSTTLRFSRTPGVCLSEHFIQLRYEFIRVQFGPVATIRGHNHFGELRAVLMCPVSDHVVDERREKPSALRLFTNKPAFDLQGGQFPQVSTIVQVWVNAYPNAIPTHVGADTELIQLPRLSALMRFLTRLLILTDLFASSEIPSKTTIF